MRISIKALLAFGLVAGRRPEPQAAHAETCDSLDDFIA